MTINGERDLKYAFKKEKIPWKVSYFRVNEEIIYSIDNANW